MSQKGWKTLSLHHLTHKSWRFDPHYDVKNVSVSALNSLCDFAMMELIACSIDASYQKKTLPVLMLAVLAAHEIPRVFTGCTLLGQFIFGEWEAFFAWSHFTSKESSRISFRSC